MAAGEIQTWHGSVDEVDGETPMMKWREGEAEDDEFYPFPNPAVEYSSVALTQESKQKTMKRHREPTIPKISLQVAEPERMHGDASRFVGFLADSIKHAERTQVIGHALVRVPHVFEEYEWSYPHFWLARAIGSSPDVVHGQWKTSVDDWLKVAHLEKPFSLGSEQANNLCKLFRDWLFIAAAQETCTNAVLRMGHRIIEGLLLLVVTQTKAPYQTRALHDLLSAAWTKGTVDYQSIWRELNKDYNKDYRGGRGYFRGRGFQSRGYRGYQGRGRGAPFVAPKN